MAAKFGKRVNPVVGKSAAELIAAGNSPASVPVVPVAIPAPVAPSAKPKTVAELQGIFVTNFILANRDVARSKGLHGSYAPKVNGVRTGAPSLLGAIKVAFDVEDGVAVLKALETAGVISQRACKGGYMTYLSSDAPAARPDPASREDLLAKYLA